MSAEKSSGKLLISGIIISMFFWGLSWPSGKVLTGYMSLFNFAVCRYFIVLVTLIPILLVSKTKFSLIRKGIPFVLAAGFFLALYSYLFYQGLKHGYAGAGGVLVTTLNPIMAYTIGIIISKKWPRKNEFFGLLLGVIAGSLLMKIWDHASNILESGNLYFLSAAFTWAVMSKFTSKAGLFGSSLSFSFWQYGTAVLCLVPWMNFSEAVSYFHITDFVFWGNFFFSSAIVTSLATTLYFYATTKLGAEKASSFIFLVPVAAEFSAWLFLNEPVYIHTIVGGLFGMMAVYMINRR
jgi:drug/metabolite transporter (DMT)-like permease